MSKSTYELECVHCESSYKLVYHEALCFEDASPSYCPFCGETIELDDIEDGISMTIDDD
jgi:hypothetical protein